MVRYAQSKSTRDPPTAPQCTRISASSNRSAKAITSADSVERATRRDLYDLYETGIALWLSSAKRTMRPSYDDKLAFVANAASHIQLSLSSCNRVWEYEWMTCDRVHI